MSDHEQVAHCPPTNEPYSGNYVVIDKFQVGQNTLDGLNALIHWIKGFEAGGNHGRIPGGFELVMHYRNLRGHGQQIFVEKNIAIQARLGRACMAGYKFEEFMPPCSLTKDNPGSITITHSSYGGAKKWELQWPAGYDNFDWIEAILNMAGVPQ